MSRISIHEVIYERKEDDTGYYLPYLYSICGIVLEFADRAPNLSGMEGVWLERLKKYIKKSKFWQSEYI
ncbi:hypothetical protein [Methanosarcina barkeri]|uniref:hypothetical protein n=1 Tax=Methanosarcina barkeri TaxID=2208 RepID=UPI000AAE4E4E|nr:hypothetical protein [Methanosarcina barkeri]